MTLLGDFLAKVLEREEVQQAAASLLVDFFQPKPRPGLEDAKRVIEIKATVKDEDVVEDGDGPSE